MSMQSCAISLPEAPRLKVPLVFSDFNRLRWAVEALQVHPELRRHLLATVPASAPGSAPVLTDSVVMQSGAGLPEGRQPTHVVLWDGLNSLIEWRQRRPLPNAAEPRMVFVGQLPEAEAALPEGAWPLYPRGGSGAPLPAAGGPQLPWRPRWQAWVRRQVRPWQQRLRQPEVHRQLAEGGRLVFCGAVRHNRMLLDDSFRGARLAALRAGLDDLLDLPWDTEPQRAQARIVQAVGQLQRSAQDLRPWPEAADAAEWAGLFNVLNLLHRQQVLSLLTQRTERLTVIEFGRQAHFDAYDAAAYRGNVYLDFGSTCGSEWLYPRRLDIERSGKQALAMRLLQPGQTLGDWLARQGPEGFVRQTEADAQRALSTARLG